MIMILIFSIYLMMSSMEWLLMWSGMEINVLAFLSLCKSTSNQGDEFEFKYFIIQFIGSTLFLMSSLFNSSILLFASLSLKLLLVPFVFWILPCLNWINKETFIYLLTMQKIGPLFIMISFVKISKLFISFLFLNIIISLFFIYKKNSMKFIMTFSSVTQLSFMILLINISLGTIYAFFFIYVISSFFTMLACLYYSFSLKKSLILFIISGFPPFFLFFFKMWLISFMMIFYMKIISIIIVLTSSVMTYVYMKMMLKNFFFNFFLKINCFVKQPKFWFFFQILGLFLI
nr:NADH dehydrogenase subunit 2 [Liposcelis entomophila]